VDKQLQGPFTIQGLPICLKTFEQLPGFIFVGIEQKAQGGFGMQQATSHGIEIFKAGGNILQ
jgi:hypothetical protein